MKEIKTINYLKKEAQPLPGDPNLPPGTTGREIEEQGGDFREEKEDIFYSTIERGREPIEIIINGDGFNKWNEEAARKMGAEPEAWEYLPLGENVLKIDYEFEYDPMNQELRKYNIIKITSSDGGVDLTDISDYLQSYEPFIKQLKKSIREMIMELSGDDIGYI